MGESTVGYRRLKAVLWYRLRTRKSKQAIADKLDMSYSQVDGTLRDHIPKLEPSEFRELLASINQRSQDHQRLDS